MDVVNQGGLVWLALLCRHTHLVRHVVTPSGLTIVNPGSVGW
jgi:hypothetical protein